MRGIVAVQPLAAALGALAGILRQPGCVYQRAVFDYVHSHRYVAANIFLRYVHFQLSVAAHSFGCYVHSLQSVAEDIFLRYVH